MSTASRHADVSSWHGSPIRLNGGGSHVAAQGRHTPRHRHDNWELVYYRQGRVCYQIDAELPCPASPGVVWLTPPGRSHIEEAVTAFANFWIHFTAPVGRVWPQRLHDDAEGSLGRVCAAIVHEFAHRQPDRPAMLDCLARELEVLLARAVRRPPPDRATSLVAAAEKLMADSFDCGVSLAGLASRLQVSVSTLRAAFQRVRGQSPRQVLQHLRAERALLLVTTSDLRLEDIASVCGYDSASHLGRWMRRLHGSSPSVLRRAGRPS